jgi:hypothetical protein
VGAHTNYINEAELRNAPDTTAWRRGAGIATLIVTGIECGRFAKKPSIRHFCQIVELAKADGEPSRGPAFMRLLVAPEQPRIEGEALDFRDEVMAQISDCGDAEAN